MRNICYTCICARCVKQCVLGISRDVGRTDHLADEKSMLCGRGWGSIWVPNGDELGSLEGSGEVMVQLERV